VRHRGPSRDAPEDDRDENPLRVPMHRSIVRAEQADRVRSLESKTTQL
jgi:hypothetical protein